LLAAAVLTTGACGDGDELVALDVVEGEPFLDEVFHFSVQNNVQFGRAVGAEGTMQALRLDVFQPQDDPEGLRPAVVWLHGGGLTHGGRGEMTDYARRFAQRGYVAVTIDYRLFPLEFDYRNLNDPVAEVARLAAQHDAQAAVRWLRANAPDLRVDPGKIVVGGYSSGGTTALAVAFRPDDPGESGNPGHSSAVAGAVIISGSPLNITRSGSTMPILLVHGDKDRKAPHKDAQEACAAMPGCQLITIPDADHSLLSTAQDRIIAEAAAFLKARLVQR
jgi:acetyl esterase/lipase